MAIMDLKCRAFLIVRVSVRVEIANADHVFESLCAHRPCVHSQRATDRAGNSLHPLQSAQIGAARRISDFLQFCAHARRDFVALYVDLVEIATRRMSDDAAEAAVAHEEIRSPTDNEERQIFAAAKPDQLRE